MSQRWLMNSRARADGAQARWGVVMSRDAQGVARNEFIASLELQSQYDSGEQAVGQAARICTEGGSEYQLTGRALSLIPLRNRRKDVRVLHKTERGHLARAVLFDLLL